MSNQPTTTPTRRLSPELIGILSTGVALAALLLMVWTGLRADLSGLRDDMREDLADLRIDLRGLEGRLRAVETRLYAVEMKTGTPAVAVDELVPPPDRSNAPSTGQIG